MKILVCGAESSGSKLAAWILSLTSATVAHRSVPHGSLWTMPTDGWDHLVITHRHGPAMERSQVAAGHVDSVDAARWNIVCAYRIIYSFAHWSSATVHTVTYEALLHEEGWAILRLVEDIGLTLTPADYRLIERELGDANLKHYQNDGPWFSDQRPVEERPRLETGG